MANRRFIDFPIAASVGDNDIVLIWQDGLNKQTTKATLLQGSPQSLAGLTDVDIAGLTNGQILQYNSTLGKWENVDRTDINLSELGDVTIVSPTNGQVLVYNSSTSKWENSSGGYVPYTGAVTTVNLGAQTIQAGSFVKAGGTSSQFLKADGSVDSSTYGTGTVTSVALTMPTAFSVANSPVTTTGTLAVTATGTTAQYIRGDGSLATFPGLTGFVPYTGATADVDLGTHDLTAERGTFTNNGSSDTLTVNHTSGSGYGIIVTKGGNNEALYVSKTSGSGNAMTVVGGRTSLVDLALSSVSNTAGDFLTLSGGVVHKRTAAEVRTDIGAGTVTSVAALTLGTSGTDLSSSVANGTTTPVITLNVPTASATNRGALSAADWSTFNAKMPAITFNSPLFIASGGEVGITQASGSTNGFLSSTDWTTFNNKQNALTNPVTGTGTTNFLPKFTGASTIGNSQVFDNGTNVGIGTTSVSGTYEKLAVAGGISIKDNTNAKLEIGRYNTTGAQNSYIKLGANSNSLRFTNNTDIADIMELTNSGNLGLGVTPSAWFSAYKVIQVGNTASFFGVGSQAYIANNAFVDSTDNFAYITSNSATLYRQNTGIHYWYNAASGTAGNAISFTQAMTLTSGGNLLVGTTTDAGFKLDVNGTGRFSGSASTPVTLTLTSANSNCDITMQSANSSSVSRIRNGTNDLQFHTNGTLALTLASNQAATFSSSVTANAASQINGTAALSTQQVSTILTLQRPFNSGVSFENTATFNVGQGSTYRDGRLDITLSNTDRVQATIMTLLSSGNVGIGTTAPGALLDIRGSSTLFRVGIASGAFVELSDNQISAKTSAGAASDLYLNVSGAKTILNRDSGNVLIGTTTDAGDKLQVNGAIKTSAPSGGTAGSWKFGTATSGIFTIGGKIRIEINGVAYDILTT
jgi:hypothetical protein